MADLHQYSDQWDSMDENMHFVPFESHEWYDLHEKLQAGEYHVPRDKAPRNASDAVKATPEYRAQVENERAVSCGTVIYDPDNNLVVIIKNNNWPEKGNMEVAKIPFVQWSKGGMKGDEILEKDHWETAIRETHEETGIVVQLLPKATPLGVIVHPTEGDDIGGTLKLSYMWGVIRRDLTKINKTDNVKVDAKFFNKPKPFKASRVDEVQNTDGVIENLDAFLALVEEALRYIRFKAERDAAIHFLKQIIDNATPGGRKSVITELSAKEVTGPGARRQVDEMVAKGVPEKKALQNLSLVQVGKEGKTMLKLYQVTTWQMAHGLVLEKLQAMKALVSRWSVSETPAQRAKKEESLKAQIARWP